MPGRDCLDGAWCPCPARQATMAALRPTSGVRKEAIERSGTPLPSGIIPEAAQRVVRPVIRSRSDHSPGS